MAAYTSATSGGWVAGAAAVWNASGSYPGDTSSQADTVNIANGHVVDLDFAELTGTAAITVQDGGTLRVTAEMTDAACLTALTCAANAANGGGKLTFLTGGARTIIVAGNVTFNASQAWDASAAGDRYKILISCASGGNYTLTVAASQTITASGRSLANGAWKAFLAQAHSALDTTLYVDDGAAGNVSAEWVVGDKLLIAQSYSTPATTWEIVTVTADNGFADGKHSYGVSALTYAYNDNVRVYNARRSMEIGAYDDTKWVLLATTGTMDLSWVSVHGCGDYRINTTDGSSGVALYSARATYRATVSSCIAPDPRTFDEWLIAPAHSGVAFQAHNHRATFVDSAIVGGNSDVNKNVWVVLEGCEVCGTVNWQGIIQGGYLWGSQSLTYLGDGQSVLLLSDVVVGRDPGGSTGISAGLIAFDLRLLGGTIHADSCSYPAATKINSVPQNEWARLVETNTTSGARIEYQRYGTVTKATDTDFVADVCDQIDPSSSTYPFRYSIWFPVAASKTPTLTFAQKGGGTLGACTVALGYSRCGLTGIASGGTITPDTDGGVSTHTVTFTGTTDCAGEVEVIVEVLDSSSGLLSVGDLAVSGNIDTPFDSGALSLALRDRSVWSGGAAGAGSPAMIGSALIR